MSRNRVWAFRWLGLLALSLWVGAAWAQVSSGLAAPGYRYYEVGDVEAPRPAPVSPAMMLMGGGDWVPEAFEWFAQRAGHGRVVILRASGADELQDEFYRRIGGITSAQTLVFEHRRAASDPNVLRVVRGADAIFIAGGDQARYIRFWKGTELNAALNEHVRAGKPIGGTSAGLAILGHYAYGALDGGSITSAEALVDPMGSKVTMDNGFLAMPYLANVVTDTHFAARDRLGRLIVFVARAAQHRGADDVVGIGVDEDTALCVEADGRARIFTLDRGYAWLVTPRHAAARLADGQALSFHAVPVTGVGPQSLLHLDRFEVENPAFSAVADVADGQLRIRHD